MKNLANIVKQFPKKKIVVVGDVMLDTYIHGSAVRLSPEAPVPDVFEDSVFHFPGGAANVASNISSLGGNVSLFGFIGKDWQAGKLVELLNERKVALFPSYNEKTTQKTRILAQDYHHICRVSREDGSKKNLEHMDLSNEIKKADIVIISDYAKGAIRRQLVEYLTSLGKKIIVDPKPKNFALYRDINLLKMNSSEARQISGEEDIYHAGRKLKEMSQADIIITRGSEGVSVFDAGYCEFPASARTVADITGAGDTFLAVLSLAIASEATLRDSAMLANYASGVAVSKNGTYSVSNSELIAELEFLKNQKEVKS